VSDPRLASFLGAPSEQAASDALAALIGPGGEIDRVVGDTVRRELRASSAGASHIDDVAAEVRLRLVRKLWTLRASGEPREPIDDVLAYAATAAEYGCYAFLRRQYPERTRFRNRVRYALSHHPHTSLARVDNMWRCESRRPVRRAPEAGASQAFLDDPRRWISRAGISLESPLPALIDQLMASFDRPIELDRFVDHLAALLGVVDRQVVDRIEDRGEDTDRQLVDPVPGIGDVLLQREALGEVWKEIAALPPRQRAALLLNLRDPEGGAVLHLLPATGVVASDALAGALGLSAGELAALWDKLPLDDLSIAATLGATRQQVINLRKAARARLLRRRSKFEV
jgi:hypothetical protein